MIMFHITNINCSAAAALSLAEYISSCKSDNYVSGRSTPSSFTSSDDYVDVSEFARDDHSDNRKVSTTSLKSDKEVYNNCGHLVCAMLYISFRAMIVLHQRLNFHMSIADS
jgi:hypothetical protein